MLLWWKSIRYRVHLADRLLVACEVHSRGHVRRVVRKTQLPFEPGGRLGALRALREWMASGGQRPQVEWVLGLAEVKYVLLPWSRDLQIASLRDAFAAALFQQQFDEDPGAFAACFTATGPKHAQLVSFVSRELLSELAAHARESKARVTSIEPGIATVLSRFDGVLKNERGALCVIDGGHQAVIDHEHGRVTGLALRPVRSGIAEARRAGQVDDEVLRVFSSVPTAASQGSASTALVLPNGSGFTAAKDSAYAFALCGVF